MNMGLELKRLTKELEKILQNFRKTPNRDYSSQYLLAKQTFIRKIRNEFYQEYRVVLEKDESLAVTLKKNFEAIYKEVSDILEKKSEPYLQEINDSDEDILVQEEMASFDITAAIKVIPEFKGESKELSNFLNIIEFLHDTLKDEAEKAKLIKFVLKTRLSEKVKNKLVTQSVPTNLKALQDTLQYVFKPNKTPLAIQTELGTVSQGNKNITDYSQKVETLMAQLNMLQISEQGEAHRDIISKLNEQLALNAFKNGLNEPLKATIYAARPKTLQEAVQIASEIERPPNQANLFHYNRASGSNNFRRNFNPNFRQNNFRRSNFSRFQNNQGMHVQSQRSQAVRQSSSGNSNNGRNRLMNSNFRNNNNNNFRNNNNRRVQVVNSGNGESPESETGLAEMFHEE